MHQARHWPCFAASPEHVHICTHATTPTLAHTSTPPALTATTRGPLIKGRLPEIRLVPTVPVTAGLANSTNLMGGATGAHPTAQADQLHTPEICTPAPKSLQAQPLCVHMCACLHARARSLSQNRGTCLASPGTTPCARHACR